MKKLILIFSLACAWTGVRAQTTIPDTPVTKLDVIIRADSPFTAVPLQLRKGKYHIVVTTMKPPARQDGYPWYKRFSLVKSFDSQTDQTAAASFSLVFPKDSVSSQNFAFAVGVNVLDKDAFHNAQLKPFFGWRKNTLSSKKQNVITSGLNYQMMLLNLSATRPFQLFAIATANYKNDRIKSAEGSQASLYLSPSFNGKGGKFYPMPDVRMKSDWLELIYNVYAGLELEHVNSAKKAVDQGEADRLYGRILATITPLPDLLDERLQFVPDYTWRSNFSNTIQSENNVNKLWKYSINLVLFKQDSFGSIAVGYDFQKGVDPSAGYQDQQVGTLSLKIKIIPK
jgi:hypothetical protein